MPVSDEIVVHHEVGLHARPAAQFVKLAANYGADILVENLTKEQLGIISRMLDPSSSNC